MSEVAEMTLEAAPATAAAPRWMPAGGARDAVLLLSRFVSVGLFNTALSLAVIMGLDRGLHVNPQVANAGGYAVGVASGFVLSRSFVFRSSRGSRDTAPRYFAVVLAGFCLNQLVLLAARQALKGLPFDHLIAQLCAMASYTISVFIACRFWVFRSPIDPVIATA
jgi:putative flippase GtrA